MAKWTVMLVLALVVVHASARNVPTTTTMSTSTTAPSSVPASGAGVGDKKNFLTYGGVGGYSGVGANGLPFGGVGGLGGVTPIGGAGGLGGGIGGGVGFNPLGGDGGLGGAGGGLGGLGGLGGFGGLGGGGGAGGGVGGAIGGGVGGGTGGGVGTGVVPFPWNIGGFYLINSLKKEKRTILESIIVQVFGICSYVQYVWVRNCLNYLLFSYVLFANVFQLNYYNVVMFFF